jgi:hypothetical protein
VKRPGDNPGLRVLERQFPRKIVSKFEQDKVRVGMFLDQRPCDGPSPGADFDDSVKVSDFFGHRVCQVT